MNFYRYNGFLNIYKESGWTSMDVCAKLKGMLGVRRIGHAGTLDPMAEGVLPVACGRATKDIDLVGDGTKEYKTVMLLGQVTDTEDTTGRVIGTCEGELPDEESIRGAAKSFVGEYEQLTPRYSARKVAGKKLYQYARAGIEVERKRKRVTIYDISIDRIELPRVEMTVRCSKGTYIRTLCHDIGAKLGCGACMAGLVRTRVGDFAAADALKLGDIHRLKSEDNIDSALRVIAPTAVSIGKFDGTHIGHQALLRELKKKARDKGLKTLTVVLTSDRKDFVTTGIERKRRMAELGIDYCILLKFSKDLMNMTAESFLEDLLIKKYNMKAIVAGEDVNFGRARAGDAAFLMRNSDRYGFDVRIIKKISIDLDGGADGALTGAPSGACGGSAGGDAAGGGNAAGGRDAAGDCGAAGGNEAGRTGVRGGAYHAGAMQAGDLKNGLSGAYEDAALDGGKASGDITGAGITAMEEGSLCGSADRGGMDEDVPPEIVVSSTLLRSELARGDMLHVTRLLGVPYSMGGTIVHGRRIGGSMLGMPTFNIFIEKSTVLPPYGVYAVSYEIFDNKENVYCSGRGIANLGLSPTVTDGEEEPPLRLETHAFGDIGDCYGRYARVSLRYFVRGERRFADINELKEQIIGKDVPAAEEFFKRAGIR